jgi:hypothetical protein
VDAGGHHPAERLAPLLADDLASAADAGRSARSPPAPTPSGCWAGCTTGLRNPRVWALGGIYFGLGYGLFALSFLPTIVAGFSKTFDTSFSIVETGLLVAIPYTAAGLRWCCGRGTPTAPTSASGTSSCPCSSRG